MFPEQLADPLGAGTIAGALTDLQGLITTTYVPLLVGAVVFGTAIGIGIRWLRRGLRTSGSAK